LAWPSVFDGPGAAVTLWQDDDAAEKLAFWGIVDDYVFESVLRTVESRTHAAAAEDNPTLLADAITFARQQLATGNFRGAPPSTGNSPC
jgi:hypothetical protein